jgi:hypothetical protein
MENARIEKGGNRNDGNATNSSHITGNDNNAVGRVRANDESVRAESSGIAGSEIESSVNRINANRGITGNAGVEITDGYYFTPRGTIERIPDGHYISDSGKLRKRRVNRSDSSNADGNARTNRSDSGRNEEEFTSANILLDKPLNVRGGRKRKTVKQETSKLTMITLLSSGAAAIFTSISLLTKHDHWALQTDEAKIFAEALNDAINTLPEKYYAQVIAIIENWIPWINLTFVVGAIVVPRIEASAKRIEKRHTPESKPSDAGNARTEDNPFRDISSIGYDQR